MNDTALCHKNETFVTCGNATQDGRVLVVMHHPFSKRRLQTRAVLAGIIIVFASACGSDSSASTAAGSGSSASGDGASAEETAEANIASLQPADDITAYEVLNVADGTVATLAEVADGDRPVLLWFYAPH